MLLTYAPESDRWSWLDDAACRGMTSDEAYRIFFPDDPGSYVGRWHLYDEARVFCARCPVVAACLADALRLRDREGFRGGATPEERRKMRRRA